jgi:hypothetical protein
MDFGFIILRNINSSVTAGYWKLCYDHIRVHYPNNPIMIIDDNSNKSFISPDSEKDLINTTIVESEYPGRGELLPYLYFLKHKPFTKACILHDSVFINKKIDLDVNTDPYSILWEFEHNWDQIEDEIKMIKVFENEELLKFYENKELWKGCFGGMCIITYDFLKIINNKYNLSLLTDFVKTRYNRSSFERVIACLFQINSPKKCLFGNIHYYCRWGLTIEYLEFIKSRYNLPFIKIWTGR